MSKTDYAVLDLHLDRLATERREERAASATAAAWIEWAFEPSPAVKAVIERLRRASERSEVGHG